MILTYKYRIGNKESTNMNPLMIYAPHEKVFCKLPSNLQYYDETVIKTASNNIGVKPMSARDEMLLNNPDALMNGKAVQLLIESTVPSILDASKISIADAEVLMLAIKKATGDDEYTFKSNCPSCEKEGEFSRDIDMVLSNIEVLDKEYKWELDNGVVLFLKPCSWESYNTIQQVTFRQQKLLSIAKSQEVPEEEKREIFNAIFKEMIELNTALVVDCIHFVSTPNGAVHQKEYIKEFVNSLDKNTVKSITAIAEKINNTGASHSLDAECPHCQHKWIISGLRFDPSHFFE